jgi:hypothetical protein
VLDYSFGVLATSIGAIAIARAAGGEPPDWWLRLRLTVARWNALRRSASKFSGAWDAWLRMKPATIAMILLCSALHIAGRIAVLPALLSDRLNADLLGPAIGWPLVLFHGGALVPLPAAGGAVELVFGATLGSALGSDVGAALVWWRIYTFYLLAATGWLILAWLARPQGGIRRARTADGTAES